MATLLDWLGAVGAQVNPFDNGETYGSYLKKKNRQTPNRPNIPIAQSNPTRIQLVGSTPQRTTPLGVQGVSQPQTSAQVFSDINQKLAPKKPLEVRQQTPRQLQVRKAVTQPHLNVSGAKPTVQRPNWFQENVMPVVNEAARGANTAIGTVQTGGNAIDEGVARLIGNKKLAQKFHNQKTFLDRGQGILGQGGVRTTNEIRTAKPQDALVSGALTGYTYAPYFIGGGTGKLAAPLAKTVGTTVAAKAGSKLAGNLAGRGAVAAADAAVAAPTFAALDAGRQGITAVQNGGQTGFDPLEAVRAGAVAGAMAGGGRIAGDTVMGTARLGARGMQTTAKAVQEATPTNLAAKDPRVLGFDEDIMKLQRAFDTTPDPRARQQINQAITNARMQRQATYNGVLRELSQGGYAKVPGAKPEPTDPLQALKQEALKYKSAEEFVNSRQKVYHGTNSDIKSIDELKNGRSLSDNGKNLTYVSNNPEYAKTYGKNVVEGHSVGKGLNIREDFGDPWNPKLPKDLQDYESSKLLETRDKMVIKNQLATGQAENFIFDNRPNIVKYLESKGYDSITLPRTEADLLNGTGSETILFNNRGVISKQQLTDLYNQSKPSIKDKVKNSLKSLNEDQGGGYDGGRSATDRATSLKQEARKQVDNNTIRAVKAQIIDPKLELWQSWFQKADYNALPAIKKEIDNNPILKDVGATNLYEYYKQNLGNKQTFEQFMDSDITLYRGGNTDKLNELASYTPIKRKAERFGDVTEITIKPKDTYGILGDFSEGEVFIPTKSQLTDLYNQAHTEATAAPVENTSKVKVTDVSSSKTNIPEQKTQETPTQLKDTSNTEVQAGKIKNPSASTIKVTAKGGKKQVAIRSQERTGDVVTAKNVNPKLKNVAEKRYSVADDGELIPDKKGATSVFTDKEGRVKNIRVGDKVYGKEDFGDLSDVNGYASTLATMRRNVERGFGKETGDKLGKFLVDHQQAQVTKMVERKVALNEGLKQVASDLGINFKTRTKYSKKVSAAIQDFGEGARDKASLVDEFGQAQADKIVAADKWFRKQYNDMLNEANAVLKQYGYDPIPKRKNYYTHFQDESVWQKFGLKMTEVRRTLGDPTMQDAMPDATRGKIDNKLAGQSEFTQPGKRFNRFALQRKGEAHTSDAFQAFERYMEPTLNNIYMTESITRARTVSRAIAQDANVMGKDANAILVQMKEWANDLAGKSNRFDRPVIDSRMGNNVLKVSQWMQKKAGQNTIVGNLSTAVMQPIVMAQTAGKFGYKNTTLGLLKSVGKESPEMAQSGFLKRRYANLRRVTEGKMDTARNAANLPLEVIEETATRATWEAALLDGKSKGLAGSKLISYADNATEKTVAGRSLGEKPELFRSKAAGFLTQYQLEVNNYWQQLGKEMTKKQALKVFVAAYGINSLLQATTGRRVGFDPISAAIDMWDESQKEEKSNKDKLVTAGQRAVGEVADNVPFAGMALSTVMGDKAYKNFVGKDSQGGRFGVSSPFSTLVSNPANVVLPFGGSQLKKTIEGGKALYDGKLTDKDGKTTVDIPQTPANIARGLLFGKSAIPEVNQYYNNLEKKKVDQKPVQNQKNSLAGTQSLKGLTMAQQKELQSTPEYAQNALRGKFLAENKAKRTETAKKSTMSASEKKSYAKDKRIDGYIADNVSEETNATLTKYYGMKENERENWFRKENDAQYKYWLAKYENDKANGKISKIEEVKWQYNLKKDKVGAKYSKDTRDLYSMAKYKIADFISKDKNGKKLADELLAYDKALYDAGLTKYMKFRYGFGTASGGRRSGGRGGRKSTGVADGKAIVSLTSELNKIRTPKTTGTQLRQTGIRPPQLKKTALKKYSVKKATVKKVKTTISKA